MSIHNPQHNEVEFLNAGTTVVTNARFIVNGQTYAMNGVTSVKQGFVPANTNGFIVGIIIGFIMMFAADSWLYKIIGFGILIFFAYGAYSAKGTGTVILQTSSGEVQAVSSQDMAFINNIITALNNAIIHRG